MNDIQIVGQYQRAESSTFAGISNTDLMRDVCNRYGDIAAISIHGHISGRPLTSLKVLQIDLAARRKI